MNKLQSHVSPAAEDEADSNLSQENIPPKLFTPYSQHIIVLFIPSSIFGLLARLGLLALASYDGQSIFPLAYVQALGCFIMGFLLHFKEPINILYASFLHRPGLTQMYLATHHYTPL